MRHLIFGIAATLLLSPLNTWAAKGVLVLVDHDSQGKILAVDTGRIGDIDTKTVGADKSLVIRASFGDVENPNDIQCTIKEADASKIQISFKQIEKIANNGGIIQCFAVSVDEIKDGGKILFLDVSK